MFIFGPGARRCRICGRPAAFEQEITADCDFGWGAASDWHYYCPAHRPDGEVRVLRAVPGWLRWIWRRLGRNRRRPMSG